MPRYRKYGEEDDVPLPDDQNGDQTFVGVNMRLSANNLPPSIVSLAVNKRFNKGAAQTRKGLIELAPQYIGATVLGSCVFSNPSGYETIIVATASACYSIRDGATPNTISLPSGTTLSGTIYLVQAFDVVLLFRGEGLSVLQWDGTPNGSFAEIDQTASGTGTLPIPGSAFATSFANRLFVPYTLGQRRDSILVSDILDYTRYVAQINQFRINFGTSDDIEAVAPFGLTTLVIFKTQSISYLRNVYGDLSSVYAAELTREIGLVSTKAIAQIGSYLWFLGRNGVYRMTVTAGDDKIVLDPVTMSYAMQPFFDGVNWQYSNLALMAVDSERLYVVVPWGSGVTKNNAIAVYNHVTEQWEGYDTFSPSVDCQGLLRLSYLGKSELWWIDRSGRVLVMNKNLGEDYWNSTNYAIADEVRTRAYYSSPSDRRAFTRFGAVISTWNPNYTVTTCTDTDGEANVALSSQVPSRTAYSIFGRSAYVLTNVNDNHDTAFRGDYRVLPSDTFQVKSGAQLEEESQLIIRGLARSHGQYVQIGITNASGSVSLLGTSIDAREADRQTMSFN